MVSFSKRKTTVEVLQHQRDALAIKVHEAEAAVSVAEQTARDASREGNDAAEAAAVAKVTAAHSLVAARQGALADVGIEILREK